MPSNITYVTFLVRAVDDRITPEKRLEWFEPLLSLDIDLIVFTDAFYKDRIVAKRPKTRIAILDVNTLQTVVQIKNAGVLNLPLARNHEKDTLNFLSLMNAKPELLVLAKRYTDSPYLAYIDAGLSKVLSGPSILKELETLSLKSIPLILLPGCHQIRPVQAFPDLWKGINWMLSGGFFAVPRDCVEEFYGLHTTTLGKFLAQGAITWEVNVWAAFADSVKDRIVWYSGPHTDEMITKIPPLVKSSA